MTTDLPEPSEEHVAEYFRTMNERHAAYMRRAAGEPWPWSLDPIVSSWRLTNVYRELDATTLWIAQNWRTPYGDDPCLPLLLCVARQINSEDTLAALAAAGLPPDWDPDRVLEVLEARMARGEPTYTSPYRTATPQQAGDSKSRYLVRDVLDPLWREPPAFETARSLEDAWCLLTPRRGFGGDEFVAYEVVCDLRHTQLLADAPDVRSWAICGPGAAPGLDAIWRQKLSSAQRLPALRHLLALAPRYVGPHMPALELRETEHWACEYRKILEVRAGRRPERYRYYPPSSKAEGDSCSRKTKLQINTTRSKAARGLDAYFTPSPVSGSLLALEQLPQCIWEPAAGDGAIVRVLEAAGHRVIASDIADYGAGYSLADYLTAPVPDGVQGIVTNPPFGRALAFAQKALSEVPFVALLLRLNFLQAVERLAFFRASPPARVWVSMRRIAMHQHQWSGNKVSPNASHAWFIWDRGAEHTGQLQFFDWQEHVGEATPLRDEHPIPAARKPAVSSARSVPSIVAFAARKGVHFRFRGDELELDDLDQLSAPDRTRLEQRLSEITEHLREPDLPADPEAILEALDIQIELVEDVERAAEVIAGLPAEVGIDLETMERGPLAQRPLAITKTGNRAVRQPTAGDAPLDPFRGQPRLISIYDPGQRATFILDVVKLGGCPDGLLERRVVGHNLVFDLSMLAAEGLAPASSIDTKQLAAMHLPRGQRNLEQVAERFLGIALPKELARSNWATPELSTAQVAYAGADPAAAYLAGKRMYAALDQRERTAFAIANRAVPAIVRMRLRGLPFDPDVHRQVVDGWQREFAERRAEFEQITGSPAPLSSNAVRTWLTERLSEDARQRWPRTESGLLAADKAAIKRMALDWSEVRPLLALRRVQTRIETFGHGLIDLVSPVTGRLHGDYSLPTITGRMSCKRPNLQNLPEDARVAVRAGPGKRLLVADLNQVELRVAVELSGDPGMRAAFAAGEDLHDRYAAMLSPGYAQLPEDSPERTLERKLAKAGHFGNLFAQTVKGFRAYAWKSFDLELSLVEAAEIQAAFYRMYPSIKGYQEGEFRRGRWGTLYSVAGRPRCASWEEHGHMWLQLCANYAIQASAADILLEALHRVDQALPDTLIAAVHDELVLEVDEGRVEHAAQILEQQMVAAFQRWFPKAPILGLVKIKSVLAWHELPTAGAQMSISPDDPVLLAEPPEPAPPRPPRRRLSSEQRLALKLEIAAAAAANGDDDPDVNVGASPPAAGPEEQEPRPDHAPEGSSP